MALTDISHPTDIAMLTDLYELTMAQGLWESGKANEQGCFTAFYRDHPFGSAYAVMCGTAELPELVENLRFTPEDIDYLASLQAPAGGAMFKPAFLDYLRNFRAHVNIDAVPEGELVFRASPWDARHRLRAGVSAARDGAAQHCRLPDACRHQDGARGARRRRSSRGGVWPGAEPRVPMAAWPLHARATLLAAPLRPMCSPAAATVFPSLARMRTAG